MARFRQSDDIDDQAELVVRDSFDDDDDLRVEVTSGGSGYHLPYIYLAREQARELRDHLTTVLGDSPGQVDGQVIDLLGRLTTAVEELTDIQRDARRETKAAPPAQRLYGLKTLAERNDEVLKQGGTVTFFYVKRPHAPVEWRTVDVKDYDGEKFGGVDHARNHYRSFRVDRVQGRIAKIDNV